MIAPTSTDTFRDAKRTSLLTGPSGIGKTSSIVTASAACPAWCSATVGLPPADAKAVLLPDIAILAFDSGGGSCFPARKVSIPNYFDLAAVPPSRIVEEVEAILKYLAPKCASGEIGHVFLDTVTAFDGMLQTRHAAKEKNPYYAAILTDHVRVFSWLKQLAAHVTVFAQPKAVWDVNESATEKREIKGLPGAHAKITGDALERYRADVDFRFWVERGKVMKDGKPTSVVQWVTNDLERDCKDRVYGNLPPKIDADFRVLFGRELPPAPVF